MKCSSCSEDFEEKDIEESHDVPCYLFFPESKTRDGRKHYADKYKRRYLCKSCHMTYEMALRDHFIVVAQKFASKFFGDQNDTDSK